ncbi:MAG: hypothetical protein GXY59_12670 [Bacteroidales bacterium]|nr:hypothetical protein [Bacteroidales bacterium]
MILIFAEQKYPRLEYISQLIFREILGSEVNIITDREAFLNSPFPGICYATAPAGDGLYMGSHSLLTTTTREMPPLTPVSYKGETGFFPAAPGSFLPFDPFASAFLAVSRLEEYGTETRDQHGRFPAAASFLHRYGLLSKAVVNRWARLIARALEEKYGQPLFAAPACQLLTTIDVDNAWAYRHKGLFKNSATLLRKIFTGNFSAASEQFLVLCCKREDPYDNYRFISTVYKGNEEKLMYFFLLGDRARYDKQVTWRNRHLRELIRQTAATFLTGIHPSYTAGKDPTTRRLCMEKERLEQITGTQISASRQHYLLLEFPRTYRKLLEAGLTADYTMGYPDATGFRAGTATPFFFYDLEKEEVTPLKIHPFVAMDVTLRQYLQLSPRDAISTLNALHAEVKATGGLFSTIWHNESLNDRGFWRGYKMVFERLNKEGIGNGGS